MARVLSAGRLPAERFNFARFSAGNPAPLPCLPPVRRASRSRPLSFNKCAPRLESMSRSSASFVSIAKYSLKKRFGSERRKCGRGRKGRKKNRGSRRTISINSPGMARAIGMFVATSHFPANGEFSNLGSKLLQRARTFVLRICVPECTN